MQRVLRYPLLLKELLKLTPDEDPRKESLHTALSATQDIAKHVNECKCDIENFGTRAHVCVCVCVCACVCV